MGENAPSQLILYHYPELKDSKGLVLMTAEMDPKFIVSLATLYLTFTWQQVIVFWRGERPGCRTFFLSLVEVLVAAGQDGASASKVEHCEFRFWSKRVEMNPSSIESLLVAPPPPSCRSRPDHCVCSSLADCPPGSVLGQSGAALLWDTEEGDVPVGGEL